jgi:Zn-dependent peptidase ImmA (M78 family)
MNSVQRVEALAEHLLDFADVRRPPAPLSLVRAVADVQLFYTDWRTHQGYVLEDGSHFYVAVNGNDSDGERRFTVFHELYHVIERVQPSFRQAAPADWHGELLADHFALSILLSDRWFAPCARACGDDINALADACGVSAAAVSKKLAAVRHTWRQMESE